MGHIRKEELHESLINELEEFALSPTIDEKGLKHVEGLVEKVYK